MAAPDSFRTARWLRTINLVLQAVLFLTLFGGLNYLARSYAWRFDLTQHRKHSLSPETASYLRNLDRPVRIVATFTADADTPEVAQAYRDLNGLLREYVYTTESRPNGRVTVEYIDIYQRRRDADQLGVEQPNVLVFICGDKRRVITLEELYRFENREKKAFQGEQVVTAAILDVSRPEKKKIYFLTGHGELRPDDVDPVRGLSALGEQLRLRNFAVDFLQLSTARQIPEDAALIISAAPQGRYDASEQELLRQYLSTRAGNLILFLAPGVPHGLDDLLYDWGVLVDDVVIYDTNPESYSDTGDFILRNFSRHAITQTLIDYRLTLRLGLCRSVRPDPGRAANDELLVTTLAASYPTAWGETGYRLQRMPEYNPGIDLKGLPNMPPANRLGIIVASERVQTRDNLPFSVRGGRLVAIGTGDMVTNQRIASEGNFALFLNAVNWTVERDTQLNIPARPIQRFQLSLNQLELTRLRFSLLLVLPAIAAALGLFVYWSRRN
ncbi:MAG TPA: GldG family protein [Opitutaceae bacterium]|mgnify:CR=1 FL=1|nr:GldG family protein [Opitutaceae bacterium]HRJ47899.1 GldG family protein [Opitutaceae bacterium]